MIRAIAQIGAPVLRQVARPLTRDELLSAKWQGFIDDLIETMHDANGAGLAANQVYEPVHICAMHVKRNNPRYPYKPEIPLTVLVNAKITPLSAATFDNYEGCLSVPDLRGVVSRSAEIRIDALDRHGAEVSFETRGISAGTFQHELDHLDGKLFVDRVTDPSTLCTWKMFARHHQEAFAKRAAAIVEQYGA